MEYQFTVSRVGGRKTVATVVEALSDFESFWVWTAIAFILLFSFPISVAISRRVSRFFAVALLISRKTWLLRNSKFFNSCYKNMSGFFVYMALRLMYNVENLLRRQSRLENGGLQLCFASGFWRQRRMVRRMLRRSRHARVGLEPLTSSRKQLVGPQLPSMNPAPRKLWGLYPSVSVVLVYLGMLVCNQEWIYSRRLKSTLSHSSKLKLATST